MERSFYCWKSVREWIFYNSNYFFHRIALFLSKFISLIHFFSAYDKYLTDAGESTDASNEALIEFVFL